MEVFGMLISILLTITILLKIFKRQQPVKKLPPGPPKLPIIGNLHQLATKNTHTHRRLAELATVYGPIMHLQLGEVSTVVISSPEMAREVMKTHDAAFCSRPKMMMPQVVFYNFSDISMSPYGDYWRQVRKIATLELFTTRHVQASLPIREDEVQHLINSLILEAEEGSVVNLSDKIFSLAFNAILRLAVNKKGKDGEEFKQLLTDMAATVSGFSICDLYPSAMFISSISGMKRKLEGIVKRFNRIMDPIIEEHISTKKQSNEEDDFVDVLLKFHKNELSQGYDGFSLTTNNIKAIVFALFGGASETSSTTIEWVMSELLKNPRVMEKTQTEVRQVFKGKEMKVEGASLDKLKYLKLVIKETFRLHPPLPLLIPRESREKCEINGYEIPKGTRVFINIWAYGRDPKYWKDPNEFNPGRFDDSSIEFKGTNFELIPFGAGRRICPGIGLGIAIIELVLAKLLYHFDWKLPDGSKPEDMDMGETFGLVGRRKCNVRVIPMLYK